MGSTPAGIGAIILAAGGSTRFGRPKLLQPLPDRPSSPLLVAVVETALAAGLTPILVVLGCEAPALRQALSALPVEIVENERWRDGLSSSIRAGLMRLPAATEAVLLVLADQPWVQPATLTTLCETYRRTGAPIVAPKYQGRRGNPILFDRRTFDALCAITGDQGGRRLLQDGRFLVAEVAVSDAGVLLDVDRPEDLAPALSLEDVKDSNVS